ncbi:metal ABC transporter permease [Raineya sp.]|jgi:manganese/zinc/iron transport system permease protein
MTNLGYVLVGASLIALSSSIVGVWLVLRKESLRSDVVSHSVLPGIAIAFLVFQQKNLWLLLVGAFLTALFSLFSIDLLTKYTRLKKDTLLALMLSFFFACGLWLLVKIQENKNSAKAGLEQFIFGKMASILPQDIFFALSVLLIVVLINFIFRKWLFFTTFDKSFAQSIGLKPQIASAVVTFMSILTIVTGLQAVGVVMMSALLITPATIALILEKKHLNKVFLWSVFFNILVVLSGTILSYFLPKTPTGAWIVVIASLLTFIIVIRKQF